MAYQRPFLISLKKNDSQQPWGFRTFGGKEYGEPHVVEKVLQDSIAEHCGVREGDEIIQIGRANVQDTTFGQVQELIARCGNKIEMFVIREDLLAPRKGREPSHVKAVVHNPYNSPLNLYSTENIAETLAKQAEVLTEGHVSSAEEEEAPENLSFKQKSAVFQLLEEQAKQESGGQYYSRSNQPRKPPGAASPKPVTTVQYQQNKENYQPQDFRQSHTYTTSQQYQPAYSSHVNEYPAQGSLNYQREEKRTVDYSVGSKQNISSPVANHYPTDQYQQSEYRSTYKVASSPPVRATQQPDPNKMTTVYRQQQESIHTQQYQAVHDNVYSSQREKQPQQQQPHWQHQEQQQHQQWQQQQQRQQWQQQHDQQLQQQQQHDQQLQQQKHHQQMQQQQHHQQIQQQQQHHQQMQQQQHHQQLHQAKTQQHKQETGRENIFDSTQQPAGNPITYKAPPSQKYRVNWPPQSPTQQNGRWSSESPTPSSPSKNLVEAMWPPKQPTVKDLPKTGFNPVVLREQGSGRRCVWPPQRDDEFLSGRTTPQSPVTGRRIAWNPSPSPPSVRRAFGSASPIARRKDISWPPSQPTAHKTEIQHRPSPTCTRKGSFDDYVKQHASSNVPSTYRPPPGTQRVTYS